MSVEERLEYASAGEAAAAAHALRSFLDQMKMTDYVWKQAIIEDFAAREVAYVDLEVRIGLRREYTRLLFASVRAQHARGAK